MDINAAVSSQYLAALAMLQQAVERCPDSLWDSPEDANRSWRLAYHVLFFTHLYLHQKIDVFHPWEKHWEKAEELGREAQPGPAYTRSEILEFLELVRSMAVDATAALDPQAESGFYWLAFSKLELQFYNIRHLQLHTGELMERLGSRAGISCDWVSKAP
jgi:hypothetical protein